MAPLFYPILLGHGSTFMYISCKVGPKGSMTKDVSILGEGSIFGLLCWGRVHVPNILVIGNQMDHSKIKIIKSWLGRE
jgi:hypothetical protein